MQPGQPYALREAAPEAGPEDDEYRDRVALAELYAKDPSVRLPREPVPPVPDIVTCRRERIGDIRTGMPLA